MTEVAWHPAWQATGLALLHFVWQGVLIAALASVLARLVSPRHGNARYLVWVGALFASACCLPGTWLWLMYGPGHAPAITASPLPGDPTLPLLTTLSRLAPLAWASGVIVLSARLAWGMAVARRLHRSALPLPPHLSPRLNALPQRMGMRFDRIFCTETIREACVVGLIKPVVLIPTAILNDASIATIEAICAHELAHIRRWDLWVNLFQRIAEALLFFHPAVWWLSRQASVEREFCCDTAAVRAVGCPHRYAKALEHAASVWVNPPLPTALAAGLSISKTRRRLLFERVRHVLSDGARRQPPVLAAIALGLLALLAAAALFPPAPVTSPVHHNAQYLGWASITESYATLTGNEVPSASRTLYVNTLDGTHIEVRQHNGHRQVDWWSPTDRKRRYYDSRTNQLIIQPIAPHTADDIQQVVNRYPLTTASRKRWHETFAVADRVSETRTRQADRDRYEVTFADHRPQRQVLQLTGVKVHSDRPTRASLWVNPSTQQIESAVSVFANHRRSASYSFGVPAIESLADLGVPADAAVTVLPQAAPEPAKLPVGGQIDYLPLPTPFGPEADSQGETPLLTLPDSLQGSLLIADNTHMDAATNHAETPIYIPATIGLIPAVSALPFQFDPGVPVYQITPSGFIAVPDTHLAFSDPLFVPSSTAVVPEPTSALLIAIGSLALCRRPRRCRAA